MRVWREVLNLQEGERLVSGMGRGCVCRASPPAACPGPPLQGGACVRACQALRTPPRLLPSLPRVLRPPLLKLAGWGGEKLPGPLQMPQERKPRAARRHTLAVVPGAPLAPPAKAPQPCQRPPRTGTSQSRGGGQGGELASVTARAGRKCGGEAREPAPSALPLRPPGERSSRSPSAAHVQLHDLRPAARSRRHHQARRGPAWDSRFRPLGWPRPLTASNSVLGERLCPIDQRPAFPWSRLAEVHSQELVDWFQVATGFGLPHVHWLRSGLSSERRQ